MTEPRDARIAELEAQVAARDAEIAVRDSEIAVRDARIAEVERKMEELTALVLTLKERLDRSSGNSNKPPSSDSPEQRAERRGKDKSGRGRGGQPGHSGSKRALVPPEQVDEFKNLFPAECESCWAPLPQKSDPSAQRFQTVELPQPKAHVTEWRLHGVDCPRCNHRTWADATPIPVSPFGPRLCAIIALLTGVYHLSRRATVSAMSDLLGVDISLGAVSTVEARVSAAVKPAVDEAWARVEQAPVKHTDGTSWFKAGVMCSLWTIASSVATVFKILANGQAKTLAPLFGEKLGVLVSDRATALNFWAMEKRQVCWAHLLRKAISFSERDGPAGALGRELLDYIGILFDHWEELRSGKTSRDELRDRMAPVRLRVEALLERGKASKLPHVSGSCEDILEHRAALWTFVDHDGVEPTNNHAYAARGISVIMPGPGLCRVGTRPAQDSRESPDLGRTRSGIIRGPGGRRVGCPTAGIVAARHQRNGRDRELVPSAAYRRGGRSGWSRSTRDRARARSRSGRLLPPAEPSPPCGEACAA